MQNLKIVIEKHDDCFVGYPIGVDAAIVGQGDTYDDALENVRSAIRFHIETFGDIAFKDDSEVIEAFVVETGI
ncbi:MAG: type II toxin-antitoxin system HicB family antitoxin [Planctomycetes bacterium]|nr:type II toxin-antitoxin system HicB family antitoxin [Planctomycetota bacterium]